MAEADGPRRPEGSVSSPAPPAEPLAQPGAPPRASRRRPLPRAAEGDLGPSPPLRFRGWPHAGHARWTSEGWRRVSNWQGSGVGLGGEGDFMAKDGAGSMEGQRMTAIVSRFLFGPLAFQHVNSEADTGGFLLGKVREDIKDSVTDSQANDVVFVYTVDIRNSIPCSQLFSFYESSGEIDQQVLKKVISCCGKNVIGWYKYRSDSDQTMTYEEMMLHESLQKHLANPELVFLLLTPSVASESPSTHGLDYLLLHRTQEGFFKKMPLVVTNLGESQQEEYKTVSGSCTATAYCETILDHRSEFFDDYDAFKEVQKISEMSANMQEELKKMCTQVLNSEHLVEKELKDIIRLKEEIAARKRARNLAPGIQQDLQNDPPMDDIPG